MPYMSVQTNASVADESGLLGRLSQQTARLLGKPESYVMVHLDAGASMVFAGSDRPTAYVQLKSLGLPESKTAEFSAALCDLLSDELSLDAGRIYIEFSSPERHMWGWNGATF